MKITIDGVASALGLSAASVSYALNGRPGVSEETRRRVIAYAEEVGWHPNSNARALAGARADAIGILFKRDPEMLGAEPYYMSLLAGVESVLGPANQALLLRVIDSESGDEEAAYRRWSAESRVDGVILFDLIVDDPRPALLDALRMPYVTQGSSAEMNPGKTFLYDTDLDVRLIINHLQQLGHTEMIHLTGPLHLVHERDRSDRIKLAARERGMIATSIECDYTTAGARNVIAHLLRQGMSATALLTSNDVMAVGALDAVRDAEASLALVSWDDSLLCTISRPRITALTRFHEEQGEKMTRMILGIIEGRSDLDTAARPSELAVRETSIPASRLT